MRVTPNADTVNSFVIARGTDIQAMPSLVFGGTGYYAVWTDRRDWYYRIYGARITPAGQVLEPDGIPLGQDDSVSQVWPAVAWNGRRYFAVWSHGVPSVLTGRFVDPAGQLSDTVRIAQLEGSVMLMRMLYDGTSFLLAWIEYCGTCPLRGQLISSEGQPIGTPFTMAYSLDESTMGLCFDGTNYVLVWHDYQLWGRKFDRSGNPIGSPFRVSPSSNVQDRCDILPGANNRYLNVWSEFRSDSYDICANLDLPIVSVREEKSARRTPPELWPTGSNRLEYGAQGDPASLFDCAGRRLRQTSQGFILMGGLPPGIYFLAHSGRMQKVCKLR